METIRKATGSGIGRIVFREFIAIFYQAPFTAILTP